MQYQHVFHAGNFADVHKHIALLQLILALQKKAKGFLYLDTHAGAGLYDLTSPDARQGGESDQGIGLLERSMTTGEPHPAIRHYLDTVTHLRTIDGSGPRSYPGSPLLAAAALRDADAAICVEAHAQTARALQRALQQAAPPLKIAPRVITGDGYRELRALLPPPQRRGLVLIDPPYEARDEEQHLAQALAEGLARFETGVFAIWYPIKRQHDTDLWLARVIRGVTRPTLTIELCTTAADHTAGLNGSGLLIVNPPWQFDDDAAAWQQDLHQRLGGTGGSTVKWLVNE